MPNKDYPTFFIYPKSWMRPWHYLKCGKSYSIIITLLARTELASSKAGMVHTRAQKHPENKAKNVSTSANIMAPCPALLLIRG